MNKIFVRFSVFVSDDKSSHWRALLIFANAKTPSGLRSVSRRCIPSCGITRDTNEELLLTILFLGFRFLDGSLESLVLITASAGFPSPNVGENDAKDVVVPLLLRAEPLSLWMASSCMLACKAERVLLVVVTRNRFCAGDLRGAKVVNDNLVPAVGGPMVVASGLLLGVGLSDGCGGGVARCSSSRRI